MMRHLSPRVALALIVLALAGCAHDRDDASASLEALAPAGTAVAPSRTRPLATLPAELGRMGAIRVRHFADGVRQEIALDGSVAGLPHNALKIVARTSQLETIDEAVPLAKPTEATVRAEIAAAFPHVAMRVVERPSENAYGPYGLAIGRAAGGARCVFSWQWIEADRLPSDAAVPGPLSIRANLCRSGSSFDAMAAALDRLVVARGSDPSPDLAVASGPRKQQARHRLATVPRDTETDEGAIMHYQTIGAQRPNGPAPSLVSDLPPEALSGPRLASKQD